MPWFETVPMEERLRFVQDAFSDRYTMSELCARYGVSRRVGYKWLARFEAEGRPGLKNRSRAPRHCPHRIPAALANRLVTAQQVQPHWGARKLLVILGARHAEIPRRPAPSTVADLLARRGLVHHRRRRRHPVHTGVVPPVTRAPNLWTADFKGEFRTGDGEYCYPLTIADQHSRFLPICRGLLSTKMVTARPVFKRAFRNYGLPRAIRTDNGVAFATQAVHGLSYLNVWWMRFGIVHQRIHPACPQENEAHERTHRTLKRQAVKPVRATCTAQQRNFDAFRREYSRERPHEHLGQQTPASCHVSSPRSHPGRLPPLDYPGHFLLKRITTGGTLRFRDRLLYLANTMVDQQIGLEDTEHGVWASWFNTVLRATFDERDYLIVS